MLCFFNNNIPAIDHENNRKDRNNNLDKTVKRQEQMQPEVFEPTNQWPDVFLKPRSIYSWPSKNNPHK